MSYGIRRFITQHSIYTLKLSRRGHYIPEALYSGVHELKRAREIMDRRFSVIEAAESTNLSRILAKDGDNRWFVLKEGERLQKVLSRADILAIVTNSPTETGELNGGDFIVVGEEATLVDVIARMGKTGAAAAVVARHPDTVTAEYIEGVIDKGMIVDAMAEALEIFTI